MNKDYNKHRKNIIIILTIITFILAACSYNSGKDNTKSVDTTDSCGINDDFYEINDIDTTNDGYNTDSVIYVDANGNIIKTVLK